MTPRRILTTLAALTIATTTLVGYACLVAAGRSSDAARWK